MSGSISNNQSTNSRKEKELEAEEKDKKEMQGNETTEWLQGILQQEVLKELAERELKSTGIV